MEVIADTAFGYAAGGHEVVMDGIVGPWFLDPFLERGRRTDTPLHYVVLRPTLAEALERARTRAGPRRIASGPIRSLHRQMSDLGRLEGHVLDTTGRGPTETARALRRFLSAGAARLVAG
jgi:hypothetical protein